MFAVGAGATVLLLRVILVVGLSPTAMSAFGSSSIIPSYSSRVSVVIHRVGRIGRYCLDDFGPSARDDVIASKSLSRRTPRGMSATPSPSDDLPSLASKESTMITTLSYRHFVSPPFRVYIEDTDTYGVMYNGNYVRGYERALSHVVHARGNGGELTEEDTDAGNWILSSIDDQKFRSSPALGVEYVVRGERQLLAMDGDDDNGGGRGNGATNGDDDDVEVWRLEMITKKHDDDGKDIDDEEDEENNHNWVVHNSATVTLTKRRSTKKERSDTTKPSTTISSVPYGDDIGKTMEHIITPYRDEFDVTHDSHHHHRHDGHPDQGRYHVPLRSAINFFERSRTDYLGGPDALRRMQMEDDILWVVTGVDDGELPRLDSIFALDHHPVADDVGNGDDDDRRNDNWAKEVVSSDSCHPHPNRELIVRTNFVARRRGMIVECRHMLLMDIATTAGVRSSDGGGRGEVQQTRLLARATVTLMALKGSTRRPTSKLPQRILDKII